ncbi:hypothetical protein LAC03_01030 [Levilactobacillus acidifarinae]|nr:hypothetical protein LAC03_01030 [Levilactobacillus acidifarinae]
MNLSTSTIRYYDSMKLLPDVQRDANNHRIFSQEDVLWIRMVTTLREMKMPIHCIRKYVQLSKLGKSTIPQRMAIMSAHQERLLRELNQAQMRYTMANRWVNHYVQVQLNSQLDAFPRNVNQDFPQAIKKGFDLSLTTDSSYK